MPKVGMEPIRRRQLIDATIASMGKHGLADTTVQTISRGAGVSPGIIHHYFGGKDELLAATMRSMLQQLRDDATQRLAAADSPRARLEAIVDCNFAPDQFEPRVVAAWLGFWAQAPHNPALSRLQRINARRLHSNLLHALRPLLPPERAERVAVGLAAMIDGLWLRFALTGAIDGSAARAVALGYLDSELNA
ncbi:transcriptional regulator BetI (plasmid) [Azospirillum oryzae]|uniref:HTH-type transcriptional regulator BetI n=1 Tax=Azospirillum oryzae TaxID=286727 RepID=A0A6N1B4T5_9PROT|nr:MULTISPECIES: transcriptional regulator BetI [Azospirillum]KAA0571810.1 transcriptional regulator BetI [Azospirillum sp. Sh1]KAA0584881.1 transcriptional regulator BetI [Azospirillum oryzae]QKS54362.1 transcriptional regulator BetI [Azospirillum oryzae]GLR78943.1 HTH-type transcriptional regulator BetI [Azospirillum oryzae]